VAINVTGSSRGFEDDRQRFGAGGNYTVHWNAASLFSESALYISTALSAMHSTPVSIAKPLAFGKCES
jgi:hypothetical protein